VLAKDLPEPVVPENGLVVDDQSVYWTSFQGSGVGCEVNVVAKTGGQTPTQIATTGCAPYVAVDDTYVYWTDRLTLSRQPKAGGATEVIVDETGRAEWLGPIAVSDSAVFYWETFEVGDEDFAASLYRLDLGAISPTELVHQTPDLLLRRMA